eukprot:363149-Chlamydomonas_euryale.AAC.1
MSPVPFIPPLWPREAAAAPRSAQPVTAAPAVLYAPEQRRLSAAPYAGYAMLCIGHFARPQWGGGRFGSGLIFLAAPERRPHSHGWPPTGVHGLPVDASRLQQRVEQHLHDVDMAIA